MIRFVIRRVVQGIVTLWVIVSLVFILFFMTNPDPARLLAGKSATLTEVASIRTSSSSGPGVGSGTSSSSRLSGSPCRWIRAASTAAA